MKRRKIFLIVWSFFIYITLQIIFFRNFVLFDLAFCYIYISAILLFPLKIDQVWILFYAFLLGMVVDIFYDSLGIHTSACVFTAYIRNFVIKFLSRHDDHDEIDNINIKSVGFKRFFIYISLLIILHNILFFLLESSNFSLFLFLLPQIISTFFFTLFMVLLFQYLFY